MVTSSATTGWSRRALGQLWLLDDGLLHLTSELDTTVVDRPDPTVVGGRAITTELDRGDAELHAARHRRNVWVPRELISRAVLRGGFVSDSLRLELVDGRTVRFRWMRHDGAYTPLQRALESWLGAALELRGRPAPGPSDRARARRWVLAQTLIAALVTIALIAGWLDPAIDRLFGDDDRGCAQLERITADEIDQPAPDSSPHPAASIRQETAIDRALRPLLVDEVSHGSFVHTHDDHAGIDGHADGQHNPDARDIAATHGFVRQVSRQWTDADGNAIVHTITQLSSSRNATSFNVHLARYSCRFADEVWSHRFDGRTDGIGQRILHRGGAVVEQISWVRNGHRHLLEIYDRHGHPDRALLDRLAPRAHTRDRGADLREASPDNTIAQALFDCPRVSAPSSVGRFIVRAHASG